VVDDVFDLTAFEVIIDRDGNRSEFSGGVAHLEKLERVLQQDGDLVAVANAGLLEPVRQTVDARIELGIAAPQLTIGQRRMLRVCSRVGGQAVLHKEARGRWRLLPQDYGFGDGVPAAVGVPAAAVAVRAPGVAVRGAGVFAAAAVPGAGVPCAVRRGAAVAAAASVGANVGSPSPYNAV